MDMTTLSLRLCRRLAGGYALIGGAALLALAVVLVVMVQSIRDSPARGIDPMLSWVGASLALADLAGRIVCLAAYRALGLSTLGIVAIIADVVGLGLLLHDFEFAAVVGYAIWVIDAVFLAAVMPRLPRVVPPTVRRSVRRMPNAIVYGVGMSVAPVVVLALACVPPAVLGLMIGLSIARAMNYLLMAWLVARCEVTCDPRPEQPVPTSSELVPLTPAPPPPDDVDRS